MSRFTLRRKPPVPSLPGLAGAAIIGLGLGAALGFCLGELAGPLASRATRRRRNPALVKHSLAELVFQAQSALDDDLPLRECHLHVVPVGPGRIELRGWVGDRAARTRAARLVRSAVEADSVINCLLVRGEDDSTPLAEDDTSDELLA